MAFQFNSTKTFQNPGTVRTYKSRLNKLTDYGLASTEDVIANPSEAIKAIDSLCSHVESLEKRNSLKRVYYCALFYALHDTEYIKKDNPLRRAFHQCDPTTTPEGKPWRPLAEYKKYALVD